MVTRALPEEKKIEVRFRGDGIKPGERLTFHLSYNARGLVSGTEGVEYVVKPLGRMKTGLRHEEFVVIVRGPEGTIPFLSKPEAKEVEGELPTVEYESSKPSY